MLSSPKSFKIQNLPKNMEMCHKKNSEMSFSSNSRWQNSKERPNRTTNNGDMAETAKRPMSEGVSESVASM